MLCSRYETGEGKFRMSELVHLLVRPIRYVYYRILVWKLHDPTESMPFLAAGSLVVMLLAVNSLLIVEIVVIVYGFGFPVIERDLRNYVFLGVVGLAAVGLMHSAWASGGRFAELEKEFGSATRRREIARSVLFWGYITLSAVAPLALAIVWHAVHT